MQSETLLNLTEKMYVNVDLHVYGTAWYSEMVVRNLGRLAHTLPYQTSNDVW